MPAHGRKQHSPGGVPTGRPGFLRSQAPQPAPATPTSDTTGWQGLGPTSRTWLAGIGITTAEHVAAQDPFEVYARIKAAQPRASLNLLYALIGAVEGRDWREVARQDRTGILMRLQDMGLV